jgi:iron complex outermembrane receptor protein
VSHKIDLISLVNGGCQVSWQGRADVTIVTFLLTAKLLFLGLSSIAGQPPPVDPSVQDQSASWETLISDEQQPPEAGKSAAVSPAEQAPIGPGPQDILKMDVDQLAQLDVVAPDLQTVVSTVTRNESSVARSPAAVYVITGDMIRRSGARTIPDILRLVPGMHVARMDANKWAISSRGFTDRFADKLLVQIDGRTVYTPLFSGVYWDVQDLLLEDIERIEVIRGPGASVWGANAVNGVINIITKKSSETQGTFVEAGAGTEERGFAGARYGGKFSDRTSFRVYGKWFERDGGHLPLGGSSFAPDEPDDWRQARTGFRIDSTPNECDLLTLQGDYYNGYSGEGVRLPGSFPPSFRQIVRDDNHVEGGNLLARWSRTIDEDSDWSAQVYYDRTERHATGYSFFEDRDILDFDFQHRFPVGFRHSVTWGFGYRYTEDFIGNQPFYLGFDPSQRADDLFSYFVQDEIEIVPEKVHFLVGSKFEHNDYSGFEYQPTGRVVWQPNVRTAVWGAISRAVRSPSRADSDVRYTKLYSILPGPIPQFALIEGNPDFESEGVMTYEIGLRRQPTRQFYWDISVFYNNYDDVRAYFPFSPYLGTTPGGWPAIFVPVTFVNGVEAETYGFEWMGSYDLNPCWTIRGGYSFLRMNIEPAPDTLPASEEGGSPRNTYFLWLSGKPLPRWEADFIVRYVDNVPAVNADRYCVGDVRLAYQIRKYAEIFVVGRNLFDSAHREWSRADFLEITGTEVQTEVFGGLAIRH